MQAYQTTPNESVPIAELKSISLDHVHYDIGSIRARQSALDASLKLLSRQDTPSRGRYLAPEEQSQPRGFPNDAKQSTAPLIHHTQGDDFWPKSLVLNLGYCSPTVCVSSADEGRIY